MKTRAGGMVRNRLAACAATLCALLASLAFAVAPAAAEDGNPVTTYPGFPTIISPESPEEYVYVVALSPRQELVQVTSTEVQVRYSDGVVSFSIQAGEAHDADGATVPVTLAVTGPERLAWIVHHRAGNPAANFAPFVYPIVDGPGWEGGYRTISVELTESKPPATTPPATTPPPSPTPPTPTCTVPALDGLGLRAAKAKLRTGDCTIGQVRLAHGATSGKGKVVKQFKVAGAQLAAGAPVAIKLGPSS